MVYFILGYLPFLKKWMVYGRIWGFRVRGICGKYYFKISHSDFKVLLYRCNLVGFKDMFIAYRELLTALFASNFLGKYAPACCIQLNSDNTNSVGWLNKGRCSKKFGFLLLYAIEYYKAKYGLRVIVRYINRRTTHRLTRCRGGRTPPWLKDCGIKLEVNVSEVLRLIEYPVQFWKNLKNPF